MDKLTFENVCAQLKSASNALCGLTNEQRNDFLSNLIDAIRQDTAKILEANTLDVNIARKNGVEEEKIDRLMVNASRIDSEIKSIETVIDLPNIIGDRLEESVLPNGLAINKVRYPLGVVAIIYESRPLVTLDAFMLAFKTANSIILRGSSMATNTNNAIYQIILSVFKQFNMPQSVYLMPECKDHSDVDLILSARGFIDCVLPRGGHTLISNVIENSKVPTIETGEGICHLYVDEFADFDMALKVIENAKLSRPSVCNALECIVVHNQIADEFMPKMLNLLDGKCEVLLEQNEANFGIEHLSLKLSVKFVNNIDEAIEFINTHNSKHSESIITKNSFNATKFFENIDAACIYHNASTRFTDGGEFGFGAELGISTQKLHVRGPMGLEALTTYKYLATGNGQVRN